MFDENSIDLETIVEKAIQRYNNKTESILRLESHTRPVNVKDSFNFTNAGKWFCSLLGDIHPWRYNMTSLNPQH